MTSYQPDPPVPEVGDAPPAPARLGRYELLGKLATGGMGEIYLARLAGDGGFEKIVVVKRLLPELVASREFVAMFLDEARLAARLRHPNVCEVHEVGRDGADWWLAMQYLEGVALGELIARPREPDRARQLRAAAAMIAQAAEGLHHAHEAVGADGAPLGVVHRDVSPSNLLVTTDGVVKVLDFGIAKARGATARTEVGTIKGKYAYMAPEQVRGDALDRRCDVFALGIVAFELVTHQRLFKRPSDFLAAKAILEEPAPRADAVDPAVPAALADAIARALEREPARRWPTARALGEAVAAAVASLGGAMSAGELAAAVTSEHAEELSAQRTRQLRVVAAARAGAGAGDSGTDVATVALRGPGRAARAARPVWWPWAAGAGGMGAAAVIAAVMMTGGGGEGAREASFDADLAGARSPLRTSGTTAAGAEVAAKAETGTGTGTETTGTGTGTSAEAEAETETETETEAGTETETEAGTETETEAEAETETGRGTSRSARKLERKSGTISVDSTPYATLYLDGKWLGDTPLLGERVPAGKHRLRAVRKDGRSQTISIDVPAGGAAPPLNLRWD